MTGQDMHQHHNLIGGEWVASCGRRALCDSQSGAAGRSAWANSPIPRKRTWRRRSTRPRPRRGHGPTSPRPQRGAMLFRFAQLLEDSKNELARIVTLEQGKALGEAMGEVGRAAAEARFMAGEASRAGRPHVPERASGLVLPHRRGTARGGRRDLSLEFSGRHAGAQDRAGAGLGKHRRLQAVVADAVVRRVPDGAARKGRRAASRGQPGDRPGLGDRGGVDSRRSCARDQLYGIDRGGHAHLRSGGAPAGEGPARAGRQESRGRHGLRRSRRRRARDRRRGVPVQRPAVHGDQPRHRRRGAGGRARGADPEPRRPHQGRRRAGTGHDHGSAGEPRPAAQRRPIRPSGRGFRVCAARQAADR